MTAAARAATLIVVCAVVCPALAEEASPASASARVGSLHRVAAALQSVLEVQRLALIELVPALGAILEAGGAPTATPETPIPAAAKEVFDRLSRSVSARLAAEALPAVTRGYALEVLDALERLQLASSLSEVVAPSRALARGLAGLVDAGEDIVDLFSRQRPVHVQVIDASTVLDDIADALDEVARAEARIAELRRREAEPAQQLQAFMGLEVALGHALDLIAAAEESGIRVGFEAQLSTTGFAQTLERVRERTAQLDALVARLEAAPARLRSGRGVALDGVAQRSARVELSWSAGRARPAAVRVYRVQDRARLEPALLQAFMCEGRSWAEAEEESRQALAELAPRERVGELGRDVDAHTDVLSETPAVWSSYELVPVSSFGVEGEPLRVTPLHVPSRLAPPTLVRAELAAVSPFSRAFYREAGAVRVGWSPSPSDVGARSAARRLAEEHGLPTLARYRVARLAGDEAFVLASLPFGTRELVDYPPLEQLARGVRYVVTAVSASGEEIAAPDACFAGARVSADLRHALAMARHGAPWSGHPALDLDAAPREPAAARAAFDALEHEEQRAALARWWSEVPLARRREWLARWPTLIAEAHRADWLAAAAEHLASRERDWLLAELWLAEQPAPMPAEIERWWSLLAPGARQQALADWKATLDRAHRAWVVTREEQVSADARARAQRPARVRAWWLSRDPQERQIIEAWWEGLTDGARRASVRAWMAQQPEAVQTAARWPDLERLTPPERERLLREGPDEVPAGLTPAFLAWWEWERLEPASRLSVIAERAGLVGRAACGARFALRPLDRMLGFHLGLAALASCVAPLLGLAAWRATRRRARLDRP